MTERPTYTELRRSTAVAAASSSVALIAALAVTRLDAGVSSMLAMLLSTVAVLSWCGISARIAGVGPEDHASEASLSGYARLGVRAFLVVCVGSGVSAIAAVGLGLDDVQGALQSWGFAIASAGVSRAVGFHTRSRRVGPSEAVDVLAFLTVALPIAAYLSADVVFAPVRDTRAIPAIGAALVSLAWLPVTVALERVAVRA